MKIRINLMKFKHSDKTTVCVIKSEYCIDWNEANTRGNINVAKQLNVTQRSLNGLEVVVTARTTCKSPDKFDKVLGERIAESKAKIKLGKKLKKINDIFKESLETSIDILTENDSKFNRFISIEKKHLNDLK